VYIHFLWVYFSSGAVRSVENKRKIRGKRKIKQNTTVLSSFSLWLTLGFASWYIKRLQWQLSLITRRSTVPYITRIRASGVRVFCGIELPVKTQTAHLSCESYVLLIRAFDLSGI
jgi:hypothetical protein